MAKKKRKQSPEPPPPAPRDFAAEAAQISTLAAETARAQGRETVNVNRQLTGQALGSTKKIAKELDNDYTRRAQFNLASAQTGVDQVQSAQTGLGQVRDAYAAQGQDPAMQRLNQQAAGQLYRPDQLRAGQVAADQAQGARVTDTGAMDYARLGQVADVQGPTGYTPDQIQAQRIRAAQAGPVANVSAQQGVSARMQPVADVRAAQTGPAADVFSRDIRASAAERALMNEAQGGGLLGQLQSQASADLALGSSLSAQQSRDAVQSARAGMAARGLGVGSSALAAELLNRDRFATQRQNERRTFASNVLNQSANIQQAANQAYAARMDANRGRSLQAQLANQQAGLSLGQANAQLLQQAALANQQTQANLSQFNAANEQQMTLANQDSALRASLANQQAGLSLGQANAQLLQQSRLANQSAGLQAQQANQGANARAMEFQQQGSLQASLANQQAGLSQAAEQARLQQAALGATFDARQQRAMAEAGYQQQAALSNQDANLRAAQYNVGQDMAAQQANQQANQQQEQYNRAFLGQVAGLNFDQNQARTSMLSGLYGQQAGLGQTTASLQQGMAQSQVALDPYTRALGSNIPIATIGTSAGLIGQAYGQTMNYGSDLFNTNLNMQASMYNSFQNNQAALRGAAMQAGATAGASQNAMMGQGMAAGGMVLGMTALAI